MQRFVVFGGTGVQGGQCARIIAKARREASRIVLISRDLSSAMSAAGRLSRDLGGVGFGAAAANAEDAASMAAVLKPGDIVLNAAAPYFRHGAAVAQAAIAAGAHYIDICDDWETTSEILALDQKARNANISVVTGFGVAPGVTSMLARLAAQNLDHVDELCTAWPLTAGGDANNRPKTVVPMIHFLQCCVGPVRLMRDGQMVDEEPLQRVDVPMGPSRVFSGYTIGSPEAITLPLDLPFLKQSMALMTVSESTAKSLRSIASMIRSGSEVMDDAAAMLSAEDPDAVDGPPEGEVCAIAVGLQDGQRKAVRVTLANWPHGGYHAAGTALGIGGCKLAEGDIKMAGAKSVEQVWDAEAYLSTLAEAITPRSKWSKSIQIFES